MHNVHAQMGDHNTHFRDLMPDDDDAKAKNNGSSVKNH